MEKEDSPPIEGKKEDHRPVEAKEDENKENLSSKFRENPWIISTLVLGVIVLVMLVGGFSGLTGSAITGGVVAGDYAGDKMINFANAQGANAELVEVNDNGAFYEVVISIGGQNLPLYVTKDGKYFTQALVPLDVVRDNQPAQQTPQPSTAYSEEDLVNIREFSQCLADNGVKAYGAGWCGYCAKLKETFGGVAQIEPFYIECQNADRTPTEHADTCEEEEITGFPTIKLNGEASGLSALSSLEEFAEATGCSAPKLEGTQAATSTQQGPVTYDNDDLAKIGVFMTCLADKDVKIYGANWCGWTKKFVVETIGGFDVAAPIYVECTENEAECSAEGVGSYPTTKINGEVYTGDRTFAGLASATGCEAPDVEVLAASTGTAASCN